MSKIYILHPAEFKLDGGAMFGIIPKPLWERKIVADDKNRILLSLRLMYFETAKRKILIDTGIGDYHPGSFNDQFAITQTQSPLETLLQNELNIKADEITDLVISHLHFDHIGGLGKNVEGNHVPVFSNAKLHLHKKHFEYSQNATLRDAGSFQTQYFLPLIQKYISEDKVNFLDQEEGLIIDEGEFKLNYKISFGHTPYMMHPYTDKYIYMADLVPTAHHIGIPWVMGYDIAPGETVKYKQKFYDFIVEKDLTMIFEHDIDCWGGKLQKIQDNKYNFLEGGKAVSAAQLLSE